MTNQLRKIKQYQKELKSRLWQSETTVENILSVEADYKTDNTMPLLSSMHPFASGETWGHGRDTHAWFHFELPAVGKNTYLKVFTERSGGDTCNPQFIVWLNGEMRQGADMNHTEILLDEGVPTEVWLYGYTGPEIAKCVLFVKVAQRNAVIYDLYYDILYPLEMLSYLNPESSEYAEIVNYLYRAVSMLDFLSEEGLTASAKDAHEYLTSEFYGKYCREQNATTVCIGHTHIDCAWLWSLRQTREKVQRSFATVLELMRRYPEYKFMSSQPLLYKYLKEEAPELYEQVKERIKEGRWEPEGAMWVEADCNLTSGESLVRQILHGKGFFKKEFGVESHVLWLPDVFGYSAALPQILKKSGVDWFVTSKISWNDVNRMPYDTFRWKGIDGTAVNTYFLTTQTDKGTPSETCTTYVAMTDAPMISGTYKRYQQKDLSREALLTFGFGDGGGGPTMEHLELLRRSAKGIPGSPNTKIDFAGDFLGRLEKNIKDNPLLPTWQGELYLEFHRGTYTSQARNKKNNRKSEFLLQNAELFGAIAQKLSGFAYPHDEVYNAWETVLTNQFHDIIPGSSIRDVYEQSDLDYEEVFAAGNRAKDEALGSLASKVDADRGYLVFNPTSFAARGVVKIDGVTCRTEEVVLPKGYLVTNKFEKTSGVKVDGKKVETNRFTVTFNDAWEISSVYDKKEDRELITAGKAGNELRIYADRPDDYDAWEWQVYSRDSYITLKNFSAVSVENDGVRTGIRITRPYENSVIEQTVWFIADSDRIDFETSVDWHEQHRMLKAAFPVDIEADKATYDIQFGTIERPTHFNTSWDQAKFEVCAHKYADLSDGGYGVSLLNDCKYGHDIHDGVMQLSLLRCATWPDPIADQGKMSFTYAILPHSETLASADTVKEAYLLNNPMTAVKATGKKTSIPECFSLVSGLPDNVVCDTVKPAEDGRGVILRCFETKKRRTNVDFTLGIPAKKVTLCDLLENDSEELPLKDGKFSYQFHGFEIATFRVL